MEMTTLLNFIRQEASEDYKVHIPLATQNSLASVGQAITNYTPAMNEFANLLVNRIGLTQVIKKTFSNPLSVLKKGGIPLGMDVQEIYTNPAEADSYDATGANLLARNLPDIKSIYFRLNRRDKFKVTISQDELEQAVISETVMGNLLESNVTSLYSGDNQAELILMKNLFSSVILNNKIVTASVPSLFVSNADTAKANAHSFVKNVRTVSSLFTYPSTKFNKYFDNKATADSGKAVTTWCLKPDQILLIRADVMSEIDVDVLAQAFNMDKTGFLAQTLEVDNFGEAGNTYAILCDKAAPKIYDNKMKMGSFWNAEGLFWNYIWHHWQTYGWSMFANAIAFTDETVLVPTVTTMSLDSTALVVSSTTGAAVGNTITGYGIQDGTTITALNANGTGLTLSKAATVSATSGTVCIYT